jgi:hypothetical protein
VKAAKCDGIDVLDAENPATTRFARKGVIEWCRS